VNLRLFLAVEVPSPLRQEAARLCAGIPGARWTRPDQFHLTLAFWARVDETRLPDLQAALARVSTPPFTVAITGAGLFPPRRKPARVLWLGLEPAAPLIALKQEIDGALASMAPLANEEEARTFHPHLTLARFRDRPGPALQTWLQQNAAYRSPTFPVDAFHLFRSHLGGDGAVHQRLATFTLRAA
jgi:RNA 2',3'-cyclic 3'-phosphodiesterase